MAGMKRAAPWLLLAAAWLIIAAPFALAAGGGAARDRSPAAPLSGALSTLTGIAISPLLGTGAYGAYQWLSAPTRQARAALPWYAQVKFWLPLGNQNWKVWVSVAPGARTNDKP